MDGACAIATIGTTAAPTNRVADAAPDGTFDGTFGGCTPGAIRFGVRNDISYDEREATDDPTDGMSSLGGHTTGKLRFGRRHPIDRNTVADGDAAASDGVSLDPAAGGRTTTSPSPWVPDHRPATLTDAGDTPTLADADDDVLFRAIRVSLPEVAAVLVRQDNKFSTLPAQITSAVTSAITLLAESAVASAITSAITPLAATLHTIHTRQDTMITALEGFKSQLSDLRMDVNDHELRLTRVAAEFTDARATASSSNPAELETLVQSAIAPVQTCLETELALAIKNAEAALTSSFDTWAHSSVKTLNDTVDASIKAIEQRSTLYTAAPTATSLKPPSPSLLVASMPSRLAPVLQRPLPPTRLIPPMTSPTRLPALHSGRMMTTTLMSLHALGRPGLRLARATVSILTRRALPQRAHPVLRTPPRLVPVAGSFETPL